MVLLRREYDCLRLASGLLVLKFPFLDFIELISAMTNLLVGAPRPLIEGF